MSFSAFATPAKSISLVSRIAPASSRQVMDLDVEMDVDGVQDVPVPALPQGYAADIITGEEQEPGEVDEPLDEQDSVSDKAIVPYKVHVRGLDSFNPDDVKAYLAEHNVAGQLSRVEWIDDTSANFIFKSESMAQEALIALAAVKIADATQLPPLEAIPARRFSQKPECNLTVRFAVVRDRKVAGAAERSRFYLLHPEYDPEERRRPGEFSRGKYRDRDDRYRRDRRSDRRRNPREDESPEPFDANLYDDDATAIAKRVRRSSRSGGRSDSSGSDVGRASSYSQRNREKELFPERLLSGSGYSLRHRSASPVRDRNEDAAMDLDQYARVAAAMRSREKGRSIRERLSKDNSAKELFPAKVSSAPSGKAQMDQISDQPLVLSSAKLADRVGPRPMKPGSTAFNIRGMAGRRGLDQGITIQGTGPTVQELFPEKFGNAGKERFAETLEGRGRRRQRAEDLFY